jgi:hypothetical protein
MNGALIAESITPYTQTDFIIKRKIASGNNNAEFYCKNI